MCVSQIKEHNTDLIHPSLLHMEIKFQAETIAHVQAEHMSRMCEALGSFPVL